MVSVETTREALQTRVATATGITTSLATMPSTLNSSDLPLAVTLSQPGNVPFLVFGAAGQAGEGDYLIRCWVKPVVQGQGLDEGYALAETVLQAVIDKLQANRFLSSTQYLGSIQTRGVRGDLTWGAGEGAAVYHGFEIVVTVRNG